MKQKLLSIIGAVFLTLSVLPASAYDFVVDGIYYNVISFTDLTCSVTNNGNNTYSGTVTIPDVVKYNSRELKVTEIGEKAFYYCSTLENVIIGNNVEEIKENAFDRSSVEEVAFGENVSSIGPHAFDNCTKLISVKTNNKLRYIHNSAFYGTSNLQEMSLPEGLEFIGVCAYENSGITNINIPATVKELGSYCFQNATSLTSVIFEGSGNIEEIPYQCFWGTSSLKSITIPASVLTIRQEAFCKSGITELKGGDNVRTILYRAFGQTKLITVDLGPSLKEMDYNAFSGSENIRTVNCYMPVVPELTGTKEELFDGKTYIDGVLNVLVGAEAQYENAEYWKNFWNIQPAIENSLGIFSFNVYASVTSGNGKILLNGEDTNRIAAKGDSSVTFTFVPDYGCKLTGLTFNGKDCLDQVVDNTFKVEEIKETSYLRATYTSTPVQLTFVSGTQGVISLSIPYGASIDCILDAQEGWEIDKVTFNGNEVTSQINNNGNYTTPFLTMDGIIAISYRSTTGTGIETVRGNDAVHVIPNTGCITVTGASSEDLVDVFDTEGRHIVSTCDKTIELSSGIYIVTVAGRSFRVGL